MPGARIRPAAGSNHDAGTIGGSVGSGASRFGGGFGRGGPIIMGAWIDRARAKVLAKAEANGETLTRAQLRARIAGRLIGRGVGEIVVVGAEMAIGGIKAKASDAIGALLKK